MHAFSPGDKVIIHRLALCRRPFIEGAATIIEPVLHASDLYRVQFEGERRALQRPVHTGIWQDDPDRLLAALFAHWRGTMQPELFDNFAVDAVRFDMDPHERFRCRLGIKPG